MNMNFHMPTKVITGRDCVKNSAAELRALGGRALLVTGASSAKKSGALKDVTGALNAAGIAFGVFDGIAQNPTVLSCLEAGKLAAETGADFIIGIGGGSPLDAAKAVAVAAANPGITIDGLYSLDWANLPLPVVTVGTTAGTGSEVTPVSVLTTPEGIKRSIRDARIYPALALGDPSYTVSMPELFTRSTAIDAMAHCVESYFSRAANDISKAHAVRGVRILNDVFARMVKPGYSLTWDDREALYNASLYGGFAISSIGTALPHALGYFLSERHGVPHGTACAVYLPAFIRHNEQCEPALTEVFFSETGMARQDFLQTLAVITPACDVKLTVAERESLRPRWMNNGSLMKTWGDVTPDVADAILAELFS
ncbi:MAG: iron-containing alcohol dehydrogenase [Oscillospiraceae bacterium]|nr:iron-containing alcohol dehydrogenase [Oscillospiraceae bacterium]